MIFRREFHAEVRNTLIAASVHHASSVLDLPSNPSVRLDVPIVWQDMNAAPTDSMDLAFITASSDEHARPACRTNDDPKRLIEAR